MDNLLTSAAVRSRCARVTELVEGGDGRWFNIDRSRYAECTDLVLQSCLRNYPTLQIPLHSRWRHFDIGGVNLWDHYMSGFSGDPLEKARTAMDLVCLSVILDAGAGSDWHYRDSVTGAALGRSEGLAAASVDLFFNQLARGDAIRGWSLDSGTLSGLTVDTFESVFQLSGDNPLIGVTGRIELVHRLGEVLAAGNLRRPGQLLDVLLESAVDINGTPRVQAADVLATVLQYFNSIWPNALEHNGTVLGDCGVHGGLGETGSADQIVPFHKLSQWLSYSLVEPLQWAGVEVVELDGLTGLPEYRTGGLLIDTGLLVPRDSSLLEEQLKVESEAVVEWRAVTVTMLDRIAQTVREEIGMDTQELPLGAVLQGGTWAAGREIAARLRADSSPPLKLAIDGTVF